MIEVETIQQVVNEAIAGTSIRRQGCLVENRATAELKSIGAEALPLIENGITEGVAPIARELATEHEVFHEFPGLLSVWTAYFKIASQQDMQTIVQFLRTLEPTLLASAIQGFPPVWKYSGDRCLPEPLMKIVMDAASYPGHRLAQTAQHQLQYIWNQSV